MLRKSMTKKKWYLYGGRFIHVAKKAGVEIVGQLFFFSLFPTIQVRRMLETNSAQISSSSEETSKSGHCSALGVGKNGMTDWRQKNSTLIKAILFDLPPLPMHLYG
jgi:hypothetical protein